MQSVDIMTLIGANMPCSAYRHHTLRLAHTQGQYEYICTIEGWNVTEYPDKCISSVHKHDNEY